MSRKCTGFAAFGEVAGPGNRVKDESGSLSCLLGNSNLIAKESLLF
jgi:hypothetical protein